MGFKQQEVLFAGSDAFPAMEATRSVQEVAAGDRPTVYTTLWLARQIQEDFSG